MLCSQIPMKRLQGTKREKILRAVLKQKHCVMQEETQESVTRAACTVHPGAGGGPGLEGGEDKWVGEEGAKNTR